MQEKLFFETIRIFEGRIMHLAYHQARLTKTIVENFGVGTPIPDLAKALESRPRAGLVRVKVIYEKEIREVHYTPYTPKVYRTFTAIPSDIDYRYKRLDRSALDRLKEGIKSDDIIIVKDGLITDTTIANLAFYDGKRWVTPKAPLLEGTTRARLIEQGVLEPRDIAPSDLKTFKECAIMNAMLEFRVLKHVRIFDQNGIVLFERLGYDNR